MDLFLQTQGGVNDPATGWALVGYLLAIAAAIGALFLGAYVLYRVGLWFIMTWYGKRFGLEPTTENDG